jgi:SAM-dependent methyltransferase
MPHVGASSRLGRLAAYALAGMAGEVRDPYQQSAEFIDLMIRDAWGQIGPAVTQGLGSADPARGPVVDVGAGSGIGTRLIAEALPGVEIVALEPSVAMRAVLLARVADSPELRRRVTVLADPVQTARLPERCSAVVALHMLGHLPPEDRRGLWRLLASRLEGGGLALVNLLPPIEPVVVPDTVMADVAVGRRRYQGWARAEPAGADQVVWHMTYRTLSDGEVVDERQASYRWWVLSEERLAGELAVHGLAAQRIGPAEAGLWLIRG